MKNYYVQQSSAKRLKKMFNSMNKTLLFELFICHIFCKACTNALKAVPSSSCMQKI